jgi:hydrogenase maturation factor
VCLGDLARVVDTPVERDAGLHAVTIRDLAGGAPRPAITLVPVRPGDTVLVHSGHIVARLDDDAALDAAALRSTRP